MFKNIFEAKISEKLNNFNNLSKAAVSSVNFGEWTDKFRQTIDISEKIQNFNFNDIQNSLNGNTNNNNNISNGNPEQSVGVRNEYEEKSKVNGSVSQSSQALNNNNNNNKKQKDNQSKEKKQNNTS